MSISANAFGFNVAAGSEYLAARDVIAEHLVSDALWVQVAAYGEYVTFTVPGLTGFATIRVSVLGSALSLVLSLHDTFNPATNARGSETASPLGFLNSQTQAGAIWLLVHPEIVVIRSAFGGGGMAAGLIFPAQANKPAWWNPAQGYAVLISAATGPFSFASRAGAVVLPRLGIASAAPDGRNLTPRLTFYVGNRFAGQTDEDLGLIAGSGLAVMDTGTVGGKTYAVIEGGSSESIVLRTV